MINRSVIIISAFLLGFILPTNAQDLVYQTFKDTRVINSHTVETIGKRKLDFRIGHRFGNVNIREEDQWGWRQLWGLESAADVLFGLEYGLSDQLTIGVSRTKGAGDLSALINPMVKYRVLHQKKGGTPISLTIMGVSTIATQEDSDLEGSLTNFGKFAHRMSYTVQAMIARKFSDRISLQIMPGYTHRNQVAADDVNGIFTVGAATRIQLNKVFGIIADFTMPLADRPDGFYAPFGIGLEIETGGHIFQVNFTNATGIIENDYIPYTRTQWGEGEFRLGFTISRIFNL